MALKNFAFKVLSKDKYARCGLIETHRGKIHTPVFMPVGTQATVKACKIDDIKKTGSEIILGNTYHLMIRPGIERIKTILAYADSCSRDGVELVITMLTSPCYQIEVKGANEKLAVCVVREALDIIEKMVADERGSYKLLKFISTNSLITDHVDIDRMESIAEESEGEEESEDGE